MTTANIIKPSFSERFFFWFGILLLGLSSYLFIKAHLNTASLAKDIKNARLGTSIITPEHEYINWDSTSPSLASLSASPSLFSTNPSHPFGVVQHPAGSTVGFMG